MAKTFTKRNWRVFDETAPVYSYDVVYLPEAATQTFVEGAPLSMDADGHVSQWSSGAIYAFALEAGHNATADGDSSVKAVLATTDLTIEANFLASAAADNALAAADLGDSFDIAVSATLEGTGKPGWYVQDTTAGVRVRMVQFNSTQTLGTQDDYKPAAGDTNARCYFKLLQAATAE